MKIKAACAKKGEETNFILTGKKSFMKHTSSRKAYHIKCNAWNRWSLGILAVSCSTRLSSKSLREQNRFGSCLSIEIT